MIHTLQIDHKGIVLEKTEIRVSRIGLYYGNNRNERSLLDNKSINYLNTQYILNFIRIKS